MRYFTLLFALLFSTFFLIAQKKQYRKAYDFEVEGNYSESSKWYREALYQNSNYSEAKEGLKRVSENILNRLMSDFFVARESGGSNVSKEIFHEIQDLQKELEYFDIQLNIPNYLSQKVSEDELIHLEQLYTSGNESLRSQAYQEAVATFELILEQQQDYKDSKERMMEARVKWLEDQAHTFYTSKAYFKSYEAYAALLKIQPDSRVYEQKRRICILEGSRSLLLLARDEQLKGVESQIKTAFNSAISYLGHDMLQLVDRENLEEIIEEQKNRYTGLFEEETTVKPGLLTGADWMMVVDLQDYSFEQSHPWIQEKVAYEKVQERISDGKGNWRVQASYRPKTYYEFKEQCLVMMTLFYKLIDVETGTILLSNRLTRSAKDSIVYAEYGGDPSALFPGNSREVFFSEEKTNSFQSQFSARRTLKSKRALYHELEFSLVQEMVNDMNKRLLSKL